MCVRKPSLTTSLSFHTKAADEDDEFEVEMPNNEVNNEFFVEVEKIMEVVEKMGADVEEVKRTQSAILSSPSTDESKWQARFSINHTRFTNRSANFSCPSFYSSLALVFRHRRRFHTELKHLLDELMVTIKRNSNTVRGRLKSMEQEIEKMEESGEMTADFRIRKTQHSMLLQKFVATMTEYNQTQVDYRERCKARIQRQLEIAGKATTSEEVEEMLESGEGAQIFTEGVSSRLSFSS